MIDKNSLYFKQAELMVQVLPLIAKYDCFALKGGTAINLFVQNVPRLSVDIDLTYLPIQERSESLSNIENTLKQIAIDIKKDVVGSTVKEILINNPRMISKLSILLDDIQIKIEPNLVIRGTVFPYENRDLSSRAQEIFEMSVMMRLVSLSDLYGGKICAALDRQHPRDLFDIKFLFDNEGITEQIRKGFLVYLISHDRPIHESLNPVMKEFRDVYEAEFQGMTNEDVSYDELVEVRGELVDLIGRILTRDEKDFLLSFKKGEPDWKLLGIDGVEKLPAVRWKLFNIQRMDQDKRVAFVQKLKSALD